MVRQLSVGLLTAALAVGWLVPILPAQDRSAESTAISEASRRHIAISDALQQVQRARTAYTERRYSDAVDCYRNALSVLPVAPATKKQREFIQLSLADALIARAIDYRSVGRTEEAIAFLKEAMQLDPGSGRAKQELIYTEDSVRNNPALTPRHIGDVEEVNRLLTLAYGYYDLGKYDQAIKTFQDVLRLDETNEAARRGMEAVEKRRAAYYRTAYDANRAARLAEVDGMWDDAHKTEIQAPPPEVARAESNSREDADIRDEELASARVLEQMVVPSIDVENADIMEVIDILQGHVRRFQNASSATNSRSINIVPSFGPPDTPGYKELMQRRCSFRLNNVSVKDLLTEISRVYQVDFYYTPIGVEITYSGQDYGRLVDRVFYVPPHFFDGEFGSAEGDEEDDGFASGGVSVSRIDPVAVLKKMNISFPKGASAVYHAASRSLTVRNTQRNIAQLEELLADIAPVDDRLVVLTVKVVETTEEDLEDLGFEWLLGIDAGSKLFTGGGIDMDASNATGMSAVTPAFQRNDSTSPAITSGQRSIRQVTDQRSLDNLMKRGRVRGRVGEVDEASLSPAIFGVRGVWSTVDVSMIMRGLSQKGAVDSMSSPKLVFNANSEEQVSFVDVRELFYPSSYEEPQLPERIGSTAVAVGAHPTDFVRYGVDEDNVGGIGTIVQVHNAEISPDGNSVKLALTTIVNDFEGFVDWGTPIHAAMWTNTTVEDVKLTDNLIYQPLFKRTMTNTAITVQDGAVLVMGGMREAKIVHYEDKVPILGDLPLVGRLFRSSGSDKKNRALLIFAKVNVVDPTGNHIHQASDEATAQNPM